MDPTGTDVMILKIFSLKNSAKKLAFLTQNKAKLCKILIITLVFVKNAIFSDENCDHNIDPRFFVKVNLRNLSRWKIAQEFALLLLFL
jgi:hypothetical protein